MARPGFPAPAECLSRCHPEIPCHDHHCFQRVHVSSRCNDCRCCSSDHERLVSLVLLNRHILYHYYIYLTTYDSCNNSHSRAQHPPRSIFKINRIFAITTCNTSPSPPRSCGGNKDEREAARRKVEAVECGGPIVSHCNTRPRQSLPIADSNYLAKAPP